MEGLTSALSAATEIDNGKGWLSQRYRWVGILKQVGDLMAYSLYPLVLCAVRTRRGAVRTDEAAQALWRQTQGWELDARLDDGTRKMAAAWNKLHRLMIALAAKLLENRIIRAATAQYEVLSSKKLERRLSSNHAEQGEEVEHVEQAGKGIEQAEEGAAAGAGGGGGVVPDERGVSPSSSGGGIWAVLGKVKEMAVSLAGGLLALATSSLLAALTSSHHGATSVAAPVGAGHQAGLGGEEGGATSSFPVTAFIGPSKVILSEAFHSLRKALWALLGRPVTEFFQDFLSKRIALSSSGSPPVTDTWQWLTKELPSRGAAAWQLWEVRHPMVAELVQIFRDLFTDFFINGAKGASSAYKSTMMVCGLAGGLLMAGVGAALIGPFAGAAFGLHLAGHAVAGLGKVKALLVPNSVVRYYSRGSDGYLASKIRRVFSFLATVTTDPVRDAGNPKVAARVNFLGTVVLGAISLLVLIFSANVSAAVQQGGSAAASGLTALAANGWMNPVSVQTVVFATGIGNFMSSWGWPLMGLINMFVVKILRLLGHGLRVKGPKKKMNSKLGTVGDEEQDLAPYRPMLNPELLAARFLSAAGHGMKLQLRAKVELQDVADAASHEVVNANMQLKKCSSLALELPQIEHAAAADGAQRQPLAFTVDRLLALLHPGQLEQQGEGGGSRTVTLPGELYAPREKNVNSLGTTGTAMGENKNKKSTDKVGGGASMDNIEIAFKPLQYLVKGLVVEAMESQTSAGKAFSFLQTPSSDAAGRDAIPCRVRLERGEDESVVNLGNDGKSNIAGVPLRLSFARMVATNLFPDNTIVHQLHVVDDGDAIAEAEGQEGPPDPTTGESSADKENAIASRFAELLDTVRSQSRLETDLDEQSARGEKEVVEVDDHKPDADEVEQLRAAVQIQTLCQACRSHQTQTFLIRELETSDATLAICAVWSKAQDAMQKDRWKKLAWWKRVGPYLAQMLPVVPKDGGGPVQEVLRSRSSRDKAACSGGPGEEVWSAFEELAQMDASGLFDASNWRWYLPATHKAKKAVLEKLEKNLPQSRKKSEQASKDHLFQVAAAPVPSDQPSANIEAAARLDRLKAERERLAASAAPPPAASSASSFGAPSGVVHTIPEQTAINCTGHTELAGLRRVDNLKESREHFTDLPIQDRAIRPEKLKQLMKGKKFLPLAKLGTFAATTVPRGGNDIIGGAVQQQADQKNKAGAGPAASGSGGSKEKNNATELENVVLIAVLQESFPLPKRSAGGRQYLHWTLTDVGSPAPTSLRLMLFDDALENWRGQESVKQGAIFAVLNASLLSSAGAVGGTSKSHAVTVGQATQILKLGHFPHLGFCRGTKIKEGINPNLLRHCSFRGIGKIFGDENAKTKANKSAAPAAAPGATRAAPGGTREASAPGGTRLAEAPLVPPGAARFVPGAAGVAAPGADAAAAFEARQRATKRGNAMKQDNSILKMAARLEGVGVGKMNAGKNINMMNSRMGGGGATASGGTGGTGGGTAGSAAPKMSQALEAQVNTDRLANILRSDDPRLLNYAPAAKRVKVVQAEPPPPKHRPGAFALRVQQEKGGTDHPKALGASSGHTFHRDRSEVGGAASIPQAVPQAAGAASTGGAPSSSSTSSHLPLALAADPNKNIASSRFLARYGSAVARDICNVDLKQVAVPQTKAAVEVEEQKANEVHSRLRQLEQQDAEHESKLEVRSLPVTAFFCRQCKLLTEKRPSSTCEAVGHTVEVMREIAKERLVCAKCKFSVYILNGRMPRRCGKCKGENCWRKVGFYAEKGSSSTTSSGGAGGTSAVTRDLLGGEFHARNVEHQRAIDFEDRQGGGDAEGDGFGYRGL
eukprot:g13306.t1